MLWVASVKGGPGEKNEKINNFPVPPGVVNVLRGGLTRAVCVEGGS